MPLILEQIVPDPTDLDAQVEFFKINSYVILPDLFTPDEVAEQLFVQPHAWTRMGNKS